MTTGVFDRETVLDLLVNVIPLGILAFFMLGFVVYNPFGFDAVITTIQLSIVGMMFGGLAVVTYYSGLAVSNAESAAERAQAADAEQDS